MPATGGSAGGGLLGDLSSAANQLGAGQAIDLLKGMVVPAIMRRSSGGAAPGSRWCRRRPQPRPQPAPGRCGGSLRGAPARQNLSPNGTAEAISALRCRCRLRRRLVQP